MINGKFLQGIGLTEDQIRLLMDEYEREHRHRSILIQEGVHPSVVDLIIQSQTVTADDLRNEDLFREKVREEWKDFRKVSKVTY